MDRLKQKNLHEVNGCCLSLRKQVIGFTVIESRVSVRLSVLLYLSGSKELL